MIPFDENFKQRIDDLAKSPVARENYFYKMGDLCNAVITISDSILDETDVIRSSIMQGKVSRIETCLRLDTLSNQITAVATALHDRITSDHMINISMTLDFYNMEKSKQS